MEPGAVLCLSLIFLVPFAVAGLAMINTGLVRSRNAAHSMLACLCVAGVAAGVYFVCGFALQGFAGRPAYALAAGGREWNWIGAGRWFLRGLDMDGSPASLAACFNLFTVGLAALIPLGAGAERWRLRSICLSTALLAGCAYPLFGHWVWGGGWLAQFGFADAGGSGAIHGVGGLTALAIVWILGPRRGKYTLEGMPTALPGHHAVFVLFGCLLAWVGWLGLNGAGTILFAGAAPGRAALAAINTTLAAGAGGLVVAAITRLRFGKPDASLCANGWVSGLVASSAGCAFVAPAAAVLIGAVAGALAALAIETFELRLALDDPGGAISVHAVGGIWGVLAAGIFAGSFLAQLVGVATLVGFVLPLTYGLNWLLNRIWPQRAALEGERQGLDLYELGADAYPEFLTHTEDFTKR